jgi:hypothetical protein
VLVASSSKGCQFPSLKVNAVSPSSGFHLDTLTNGCPSMIQCNLADGDGMRRSFRNVIPGGLRGNSSNGSDVIFSQNLTKDGPGGNGTQPKTSRYKTQPIAHISTALVYSELSRSTPGARFSNSGAM